MCKAKSSDLFRCPVDGDRGWKKGGSSPQIPNRFQNLGAHSGFRSQHPGSQVWVPWQKFWNKSGYSWCIQSIARFIQWIFSRTYNVSDVVKSSVASKEDQPFTHLQVSNLRVSQLMISFEETQFCPLVEGRPHFKMRGDLKRRTVDYGKLFWFPYMERAADN